MNSPFVAEQHVHIIPHRSRNEDGSIKETLAVVTDPCRPTDMVRLDGSAVGFYVMVRDPFDGLRKERGYHACSLESIK